MFEFSTVNNVYSSRKLKYVDSRVGVYDAGEAVLELEMLGWLCTLFTSRTFSPLRKLLWDKDSCRVTCHKKIFRICVVVSTLPLLDVKIHVLKTVTFFSC